MTDLSSDGCEMMNAILRETLWTKKTIRSKRILSLKINSTVEICTFFL